jgi:hypothetical protein
MKVVVLLAGLIGVLGFFQPFFEFAEEPVSAYRIVRGPFGDGGGTVSRVARLRDLSDNDPVNDLRYSDPVDRSLSIGPVPTSPVPIYFASAVVMILVGLVAFAMRRFSGFAALFSLAAGMLAIGGWLNEVRIDRDLVRAGARAMMTTGATLLLVSGLLGFAASLVVLIKREPNRPKPPPKPPEIQLPVARVIS